MKYINQRDYPHWLYRTGLDLEGEEKEDRRTTTISSSGCGLCSAVMVMDRLIPNNNFELNNAIRLSYECGANHLRGTDYSLFAHYFAEKCGLDLEKANNPERLIYCLQTGGVAVVNVKGDREGYVGVFGVEGHFIVAVSQERDGRIAVLDPNYQEGIYDKEGRKGLVEMKNDVIALCDIKVLLDDSKPADPSFYLFWRK